MNVRDQTQLDRLRALRLWHWKRCLKFRSSENAAWQWWKPGGFAGQSVGIHEAGARAFRDKLAEYGIRADVGSRLD